MKKKQLIDELRKVRNFIASCKCPGFPSSKKEVDEIYDLLDNSIYDIEEYLTVKEIYNVK